MKQLKKLSTLLVLVLILAMVTPLALPTTAMIAEAATVKLSKSEVTLEKGKSTTLKINGTDNTVTWKSNNKKVTKISSKGKVTAVSRGTATITATVGGKSYKCNVTVLPDLNDYVALSKKLASQMVTGDFDQVVANCSAKVKTQLGEAVLKQGWDSTVANLGKFVTIYDTIETAQGNFTIIKVILSYENNGLQVSFTYGSSGEIEGLWMNYYAIEQELAATDAFVETKIVIDSGKYQINGRLTLPENVENPPVIILVQGSGQSDMNETVSTNKPFRDIAWALAKQGIATIRYNKRYYQYPESATSSITIQDEVLNDVSKAIAYAKTCGKVNPNKIYILGHSLGGMLAPKIALDNQEVAGIISLAGSPRKLEDIIYDQNVMALASRTDLSEANKQSALEQLRVEIDKIKTVKETDTGNILGVNSVYWYSLNQINTAEIIKKLDIPMLFLQGTDDFQVYANTDYVEWKELLGNRGNVAFHLYAKLNHIFMVSNGKKDVTEYDFPGTVDQTMIDDIAQWIVK